MPLDGTKTWTDGEIEAAIQLASTGLLPDREALAALLEMRRLRVVIREAVGKLTNLHCKTKRDQSRLCMAFDALYVEQG